MASITIEKESSNGADQEEPPLSPSLPEAVAERSLVDLVVQHLQGNRLFKVGRILRQQSAEKLIDLHAQLESRHVSQSQMGYVTHKIRSRLQCLQLTEHQPQSHVSTSPSDASSPSHNLPKDSQPSSDQPRQEQELSQTPQAAAPQTLYRRLRNFLHV